MPLRSREVLKARRIVFDYKKVRISISRLGILRKIAREGSRFDFTVLLNGT